MGSRSRGCAMTEPILSVEDLRITIGGKAVVDGLSFSVAAGEIMCLVGESGCGKSMTACSIMGLLPTVASISGGSMKLGNRQITALDDHAMRDLRGSEMSMIFQDPVSSLNPLMPIGQQIGERLQVRGRRNRREIRREVISMLDEVGIPEPAMRARQYPFELSGGMCQRVMIAMALITRPQLLIADEPTTALDVTIQAQILELMKRLRRETGTAILLITHDIGVVADIADRVAVMHAGRIVEDGAVEELFREQRHPYTRLLLSTIPRLDGGGAEARPPTIMTEALLSIRDLRVHFPIRQGFFGRSARLLKAIDGVDLDIAAGETLALVGESGSGKSTLGASIIGMQQATAGLIRFDGLDVQANTRRTRDIQIVFQDPASALNPRMDIGESIAEPLAIHCIGSAAERRRRVAELLEIVGLDPESANRKPNAFSGGQRQRIVIARAIALQPKLLILDEPVSALDVSIRSQILNLLLDLQQRFGLSYLFTSHDLSVVRHFADRVAVMYLGRLAEIGQTVDVFSGPAHPYTEALLSAVPLPDPVAQRRRRRIILQGDLPSPANPPAGCRFSSRCPIAETICREVSPQLRPMGPSHQAACHLRTPEQVA
jgi:peptide/nickel transport system ATP-binding protein